MRKLLVGFGVAWLLTLSQGCIPSPETDPLFPEDKVPAAIDASDFDRISAHLDGYTGSMIKLAGRIVDTNHTEEGAIILASWLPYPPHFELEDGPPDVSPHHRRHFVFLFPGIAGDPFEKGPDYDSLIVWEGNKFVLEAMIKGTRTMVLDVEGDEKALLFVITRCIHVWETGESEPSDQPDSQWTGQVARTFCAQKTK